MFAQAVGEAVFNSGGRREEKSDPEVFFLIPGEDIRRRVVWLLTQLTHY